MVRIHAGLIMSPQCRATYSLHKAQVLNPVFLRALHVFVANSQIKPTSQAPTPSCHNQTDADARPARAGRSASHSRVPSGASTARDHRIVRSFAQECTRHTTERDCRTRGRSKTPAGAAEQPVDPGSLFRTMIQYSDAHTQEQRTSPPESLVQ